MRPTSVPREEQSAEGLPVSFGLGDDHEIHGIHASQSICSTNEIGAIARDFWRQPQIRRRSPSKLRQGLQTDHRPGLIRRRFIPSIGPGRKSIRVPIRRES
jgi:hypothetical protein